MSSSLTGRKRIRKSFGRLSEILPPPNLIEVQRNSYESFLQSEVAQDQRAEAGLSEVFKSVFPIRDFAGKSELQFVSYMLEKPKYDVEECRQRGITYAAPLRVTMRLVVWDIDENTEARSVRDIKEQDVYLGDIPMMTDSGTFIVNGAERVVVSQMHRSPGVFFDHDKGKTHSSGRFLFSARIIPYRGSWLDFEFDAKDVLYVRIDRRRKLPASTMLMALDDDKTAKKRAQAKLEGRELDPLEIFGMSKEDILSNFYETIEYEHSSKGWRMPFLSERYKGVSLAHELMDAKTKKVVAAEGERMTPRALSKLADEGLTHIVVQESDIIGRFISRDIIKKNGSVLAEAGDEITTELLAILIAEGFKSIPTLNIDNINVGGHMRNTLAADKNMTRDDALIDIYRVMRPGEPPTFETADALLMGLFFDNERYDLSSVGRVKMNMRLDVSMEDVGDDVRCLRKEDIIAIIKTLLELKDGKGEVDDIDHLGNRRVRSVGELMENQFRIGLLRMDRAVRERMANVDIDTAMPYDLVNAKPVAASVREFFGSSQLSQFMDQTNPLSEITHKRRLSALGPGGLTRERAGFEVRDVHPTHYGRICPIETPEGPNIGLINSLATYATINQYGFIETPYRRVDNGQVTDEVKYISAMEEGKYTIAEANAPVDKNGRFVQDLIPSRKGGDYLVARIEDIEWVDVSPKQLVSVAAGLIPFLENDDANRALMGSNMMRQAVPLLQSESPLVGTGMEARVAVDSGVAVVARRSGIVDQVDGTRIVVRITNEADAEESTVDIYNMLKFQRSNQSTCINQKPLVRVGELVKKGDIIADGHSTELGELALGRNVLVAFMPWNGYNFEDSILISERIVSDDVFTSIHIEEYETMARDTKLGQEEITRDIPNISDEALRNLDESGIVYVGAEVIAGDILIGKVTPKGESPMTPEEKLLRAIFGEKASDVRDSSLRMPPGSRGTVVEVRVFSRRGVDKDERALAIDRAMIEKHAKDRDDERAILDNSFRKRFMEVIEGQVVVQGPEEFKVGDKIGAEVLMDLTTAQFRQIVVEDQVIDQKLETLRRQFDEALDKLQQKFDDKVEKIRQGDDLSPGVMKMVKVFVAVKRKLQPGDKMAGRHGNKGVISKIMPVEDMPYLEDGTHVDIVLNPLGVPSRMNVGQILETHMGWACAALGKQVGDMLRRYENGIAEIKDLRNKVSNIYDHEDISATLTEMTDGEVVEMSGYLSKGMPIATPVFDGAHEVDIKALLAKSGLSSSGQAVLIDGRTGERFEREVTVGYIYMLKLHHLVDDKLHARSIGPYSLVTQQPLGGKAQFGGQRFGEMEVWALEAYGAAYTLQEMLTVKSDDVAGRTRVYEAIVRGDDALEAGVPESFNVLVKELRSLGLNMEVKQHREGELHREKFRTE